jgi:hypothetical protein
MPDFATITGTAFAAFLVLFLVIAYVRGGSLHRGQWAILRILSALCAGASGAFLTGDAVFSMSGRFTWGTTAVSGTAGVALFLVVWYGFGKFIEEPPDAFTFSIGRGWTFKNAANALAQLDSAVVEFQGFKDDELNSKLQERQIRVTTVTEGLMALRPMARDRVLPKYAVTFERPTYRLTVERSS